MLTLRSSFWQGAHEPSRADRQRRTASTDAPGQAPVATSATARDGLGPVEHREQRQAAPGSEVLDQRADQRLDLFVVDQAHLHPARVLQARREEVHALLPSVEKLHIDVSEVVLREFARQSFEANHHQSANFGMAMPVNRPGPGPASRSMSCHWRPPVVFPES